LGYFGAFGEFEDIWGGIENDRIMGGRKMMRIEENRLKIEAKRFGGPI
jgi:hypothetical protein